MSGGHFDYKDEQLSRIIEILREDRNPTKQLEKLLISVQNILHAYDWYKSGDTDKKDYEKTYNKEIKKIKRLLK